EAVKNANARTSRAGRRITTHRDRARGAGGSIRLGEASDVPAPIDGVRRTDEERRGGPHVDGASDCIRRAEHARLANVLHIETERPPVPGEPLDLLGEMARHQVDA